MTRRTLEAQLLATHMANSEPRSALSIIKRRPLSFAIETVAFALFMLALIFIFTVTR